MSKSEATGLHTPRPWKVEVSSNQFSKSGKVCRIAGGYDDSGVGDDIADVTTCFEGGREIPQEEWVANAQLMAAAPDLLEALRRVQGEVRLAMASLDVSTPLYKRLDTVCNLADEAVAAAQGGK